MTKPTVTIYTDGGSKPNPGPGGWAALLILGDTHTELSGGDKNTTNNQMEMTAAIEALEALKMPCAVILYTDSTYLKNGITQWMANWIRNGWKTASKKPVKNKDLWTRLMPLLDKHTVRFHWVRGHSGHEENERVDVLARDAASQSGLPSDPGLSK